MVEPALRSLRDEIVSILRDSTFSGLAIAKPFVDAFALNAASLVTTSDPVVPPDTIDGLNSALITDFSMVASSSILAQRDSSVSADLVRSKYLCAFWPEPWHGDLAAVGKQVWSIPYALFLMLDNKLTQQSMLQTVGSAGLRQRMSRRAASYQTEYLIPDIGDFHRLSRTHGDFVVAAATSAGGSGIFLVSNIGTFASAIAQIDTPVVRVEKFNKHTISLTQFGIVFEDAVLLYDVQVQYVKELNHHLVYAGASWDTGLAESVCEEASTISSQVGLALAGMGYLGAFGCDLVLDRETGDIHFMELNPRFVGETFLFSEVAASRGGALEDPSDRITCDPHFLHVCALAKKRCPPALAAIMGKNGRIPVPRQTNGGFNTVVPLKFGAPNSSRRSSRVPLRSCVLFSGSVAASPIVPVQLKPAVEDLWKSLYSASLDARMT
jgi:hypothetical protein